MRWASAVRLACKSGALGDARFIVDSVESPRLSAHVLVHHMIRHGSPLKAYETAHAFVSKGILLRQTTLLKVSDALVRAPPSVFTLLRERAAAILPSPDRPLPDSVQDDGLRLALALLLKARENRRQCSDRAFAALVNFCLLQGEIIMGSLLFVLLVKDYEAKTHELKASHQVAHCPPSPQPIDRWKEHIGRAIPPKRLLTAITHQCEHDLTQDPQVALQALANLAGLVDTRSLPYSDFSHLLRALYSCPKLPYKVHVLEQGSHRTVNAHQYFHRVIFRLLQNLPTRNAKDPPTMPPLSRETYNTLVHYALRHRLSVPLARHVLHHMQHLRRPTLSPDTATYNIILRSGSLLRRNDIVSFALAQLRKLKQNAHHPIAVPSPSPHPHPRPGSSADSLSQLLALSSASSNLPADMHTLTSYMTHLISTGNPHIVASILFRVLPELAIVDHPAWGDHPPTAHQRAIMAHRARQERLRRAVTLGPHFFTSVLNALSKAGKTGLAERVWLLAKKAEKISWIKSGNSGLEVTQGWCLPVHAYTIMMQVYAAEASKGLGLRHRLLTPPPKWQPCTHRKDKVKGWAHFVLAKDKIASRHRSRRTIGLRMGAVLYRSMFRAARDIYDTLVRIVPSAQPQVHKLQPDARFFNAALAMFGRQPAMMRRSPKPRRAHWRQKERRARMRYSRRGVVPRNCNPFLQRIVHGMLDAGFEVPVAYRRLFLGTWMYPSMHRPGTRTVNRQPLAFPRPRRRFLPHALVVHRERGLPVQRSEWRKMGHAWKHRRRT